MNEARAAEVIREIASKQRKPLQKQVKKHVCIYSEKGKVISFSRMRHESERFDLRIASGASHVWRPVSCPYCYWVTKAMLNESRSCLFSAARGNSRGMGVSSIRHERERHSAEAMRKSKRA